MKNSKIYFLAITAIIVLGVIARVIPHFPNFAPMAAIALFAVAFYQRKSVALIIPVLAWWLSDLYLNNTVYAISDQFVWFTYDQLFSAIALVSIVGLGALLLKKLNVARVLIGSISASLLFFIISNFGVWMQGLLYPKTLSGLASCYTMALPFYKASFISDLVFTAVFFSAMYLLNNVKSFQNSPAESLS